MLEDVANSTRQALGLDRALESRGKNQISGGRAPACGCTWALCWNHLLAFYYIYILAN